MAFSVGDRVKANRTCMGVEKGKVYTVKRVGHGSLYIGPVGNKCFCESDNWELVTEEAKEETKFKEGDTIRMTCNCSGCVDGKTYPLHRGDTRGEANHELWAWDETTKGNCGCHCQDNWKLVTEEKPNTESTFKKGDRVKALESSDGITKGNIYVVTKDCDEHNIYFDDNTDFGRNRSPSKYKLVTKEEPKMEKTFKVGDRVSIKVSSQFYSQAQGTNGTVTKGSRHDGWTDVKWDCGEDNTYPAKDLSKTISSKSKEKTKMEKEFKVGSRVMVTKADSAVSVGTTGTIKALEEYGHKLAIEFDNRFEEGHSCGDVTKKDYGRYMRREELEIISKSKKTMIVRLTTMMKKLLDKDTQELVEAGFIDGDLELTDEGEEVLQTILFLEKKKDMVLLAQEKIKEAKEEAKKK